MAKITSFRKPARRDPRKPARNGLFSEAVVPEPADMDLVHYKGADLMWVPIGSRSSNVVPDGLLPGHSTGPLLHYQQFVKGANLFAADPRPGTADAADQKW